MARRAATVLNLAVARLAAVLLVLVPLWVGFDTSAAQTPTATELVSNIDQDTYTRLGLDLTTFDLAQPFTTGGNDDGYQVTSVEISVGSFTGSTANLDVGIWTSTSAGLPGTLVGELTDPTTIVEGINTFTTTGIDLSESTTYVLVLEAANMVSVQLHQTESSAEDSTSATGWTIADNHLHRSRVNNPDGEWTSDDQVAFEIRINGTITNAPTNTPAEGRPTISGFTREGKTLTASTSAITDEDGLTGVSYSYQWYRQVGSSDTAIAGATGRQYTLVAADGANRVFVCVDFIDDAGFAERKCSGRSEKIDSLPVGLPIITGAAQVGQTLRASTSHIFDPDPGDMPLEVNGIYWTRVDGSEDDRSDPIVGQEATYTLTEAEVGYQVELEVNLIARTESENTYSIFVKYPPGGTVRARGVNNSPVLSSSALTREVTENAVPGTDVGLPVTATDADVGDPLSYSLEGADASSFVIDASTGQIRTKPGVIYDFEVDASYAVTVKVDDSVGGTDTVAVAISLTDVDDEVPDTPAAPSVSTTADSMTSLDVSWVEPPNLLKPAITSYDLRYRVCCDDGDWTDGPQDVVGTSAVIESLAEGTGYQVQVQATSSGGGGGLVGVGCGLHGRVRQHGSGVLGEFGDPGDC